jgi:hypothetical protein
MLTSEENKPGAHTRLDAPSVRLFPTDSHHNLLSGPPEKTPEGEEDMIAICPK